MKKVKFLLAFVALFMISSIIYEQGDQTDNSNVDPWLSIRINYPAGYAGTAEKATITFRGPSVNQTYVYTQVVNNLNWTDHDTRLAWGQVDRLKVLLTVGKQMYIYTDIIKNPLDFEVDFRPYMEVDPYLPPEN